MDDTKEELPTEEKKEETPTVNPSRKDLLSMIAAALASGTINQSQAKEARSNMGISQAYFTRKQPTKAKRKAKQKMQKASRKMNRSVRPHV